MSFELLPEQRTAVDVIQKAFAKKKHKGFILADSMGVGKTAPAIDICKSAGAALIICPAYLLYNWCDELKMWGVDPADLCVIDSRDQIIENKKIYLIPYSRINYEMVLLRRKCEILHKICTAEKNGTIICPISGEKCPTPRQQRKEKKQLSALVKQLLSKNFDVVVCDEGHYLKGWNSQRSRLILGTGQNKNQNFLMKSKNILLLTGTPFLNRIEELYNIVIRIAPGVLDNMGKYTFYQNYAEWIENTGFALVAHGVKNEADLKRRLAPIMLRRVKIEGLAPLIDETIKLDPNDAKLKKLFKQEEDFLRSRGIDPDDIERITKMTKTEVSEIAGIRAAIAITKIHAALELVADIMEEQETPAPVVIYCYHRLVLAALKEAIATKKSKWRAAYIDGGTPAKTRHDIAKNRFQTGNLDILCATIGALKEGVNLTAGRDVVFIELDYVPANMSQAVGRYQRRGQTGQVHVRKLVYPAGIEKRILKILAEKTTTINKIMGD